MSTPKREPIPRTWFIEHGYTKADTFYTNGRAVWLHPRTNNVYSAYGKLKLRVFPNEKYRKNTTRYLKLTGAYGSMLLARLKYLTFKGPIPYGFTIDHIDGNTFNNDIRNLRAVTTAINARDGGFLRKLRNKGIDVAMFPGIIIPGFQRMADYKASHTRSQYNRLNREELLQIFVGPTFRIADPGYLMELELTRHQEC